jgi:hypothetical protein
MELRISRENTKLGKIPNFSTTPGVSCVPGIPCFSEGCYAMKAYQQYPNVREAWGSNLELYFSNPGVFFKDWDGWLTRHKPKHFRMFVGGDFPDEAFYMKACKVIKKHPDTEFLVFTKRYDYEYWDSPPNLTVILSVWPGVPLPENLGLPWAWLEEDPRKPELDLYILCEGMCQPCGKKCWGIKADIVFKKH